MAVLPVCFPFILMVYGMRGAYKDVAEGSGVVLLNVSQTNGDFVQVRVFQDN